MGQGGNCYPSLRHLGSDLSPIYPQTSPSLPSGTPHLSHFTASLPKHRIQATPGSSSHAI
ncbi:unnamed protein product [Nesidiocoris tenuis]|uniref:Uncharacterized protein n=1 Tax=Nesidiocoris tenuis TaxID=355587 RepID=A0A6H5HMY2_9HEMI|nr:unnamed protein product [Nesidiocoris tenuis]